MKQNMLEMMRALLNENEGTVSVEQAQAVFGNEYPIAVKMARQAGLCRVNVRPIPGGKPVVTIEEVINA